MKKFIEKLIERLEEEKSNVPVNRILDDIINDKPKELGQLMAYSKAIKIAKELAEEYKDTNVSTIDAGELLGNGWIPCSERLPKDDSICIVTVEYPNKKVKVTYGWFDRVGVCWYVGMHEMRTTNIHAWQPLPAPYQPKGEQE